VGILVPDGSSSGNLIFSAYFILKYISRQTAGKSIILEAADPMIDSCSCIAAFSANVHIIWSEGRTLQRTEVYGVSGCFSF